MSKAASFLRLAAGLAVLMATLNAQSASARNHIDTESGPVIITLRVYDYVHVARPNLLAAESETTAILEQAGLETRWVDCPTSEAEKANYPDCQSAWGPDDFVVRLLPKAMVDFQVKGQEALGVAYESAGLSAYLASIFYDRVNGLCQSGSATLPVLLGRAMAHEIGHLLLGTYSHSNRGIMRPFWSDRELSLDGRVYALFTPEQSRKMKNRLADRAQAWQAEEKVAKLGRR
jgi:hypothetical protein